MRPSVRKLHAVVHAHVIKRIRHVRNACTDMLPAQYDTICAALPFASSGTAHAMMHVTLCTPGMACGILHFTGVMRPDALQLRTVPKPEIFFLLVVRSHATCALLRAARSRVVSRSQQAAFQERRVHVARAYSRFFAPGLRSEQKSLNCHDLMNDWRRSCALSAESCFRHGPGGIDIRSEGVNDGKLTNADEAQTR